jgi:hypothetical protein
MSGATLGKADNRIAVTVPQLNSKGEVSKIYDAQFDDETNWRQMHLER